MTLFEGIMLVLSGLISFSLFSIEMDISKIVEHIKLGRLSVSSNFNPVIPAAGHRMASINQGGQTRAICILEKRCIGKRAKRSLVAGKGYYHPRGSVVDSSSLNSSKDSLGT